MFRTEALEKVDRDYFNIIVLEAYDVSVQSKNTGHYWTIHNTEYPGEGACVIYHKHRFRHPYHLHGRAPSLGRALRSIRKHDEWLIGRETLRLSSKK